MDLSQQIDLAVQELRGLFKDSPQISEDPPEDATIESLWHELRLANEELERLRKQKRKNRPKVEAAAKLLLEHPDLAEIPVPMIAELIRAVFKSYGVDCSCSESSIRWYMSQRGLEWSIMRRRMPKVDSL